MIQKIKIFFLALITALIINSACASNHITNLKIPTGIYDGKIGNDKLILIVQESNNEKSSGFYIYNRNKAIEDKHLIEILLIKNKLTLISDKYEGILKVDFVKNTIQGKLHLTKNMPKLFFWKNKLKITFIKRDEKPILYGERYQKRIFDNVKLISDLKYGNAKGYWTESPYLDDPYIELLAKGTINLFKGDKDLDLKLDLYQPINDKLEIRPLILLVHGGGFYIGNKNSTTEKIFADEFTKRGYVVASMNYRMGFKMTADEVERSGYRALQDVHAALRFLSHNSSKYGIDPNQVYVAGTSAGAIASLNIAFMDNRERPESTFGNKKRSNLGDIETSGNNYKNSFKIKAVGNLWGAVSDTSIIDSDERTPVISFHGTSDDIVPYDHDYPFQNTFFINRIFMNKMYGSEPIHKHLDNLGIENRFVTLEGSEHEPHLDDHNTPNSIFKVILDELITFFNEQTAPKILANKDLITINATDKTEPIQAIIYNGELVQINVTGGYKTTAKPNETRIIWINEPTNHELTIYSNNKYDACCKRTIKVNLEP